MNTPSTAPHPGASTRWWDRLSIWRASSRTVLVSLLVGMLLVVGVTGGSMLFFSNLVVQGQINRLPPELREQFHDHGTDGIAPLTVASPSAALPLVVGPLLPQIKFPKHHALDGARNFLRDVDDSLRGASLVSVVFGLALAVLLARRIARPISAVSEAAVRVAAGDLSARARLLPGDRETTELARNFNAMAQGLEVLEQERRETVASIAHELRTPLTVMQARLDAIEDGIYPLNQEQVGQLSAQTQLLTRLVGDLRTLSLAEAGRLTVQPGQVHPLSLARSVAQDIQTARPGTGVNVEVLGQEGSLNADPDRLRQVLVNLVENAFKHARSRIQLTVQPPLTGQVPVFWLHVDDDGPGIPEEDRERVFETFVRLDPSRARISGGTGLGLAVVRALMLAHGGEVELSPSPLGGTRASLKFPATG